MSHTYVIIKTVDLTDAMIKSSLNNEYSFRKSLDGSLSLLKFYSNYPDCCAGQIKYHHDDIIEYIKVNKELWEAPDEN